MAVYSRRNLLIASFGPNVLLTQPLTNGQVLVYDAQRGSFINSPGSELFTASNVGTGVPVFDEKVGSDFEFNTLVAGSNVVIDKVGNNINISANVNGAGVVLVVPNNASRDALIPTLADGSLVFVQDDGRGNHEYALYLWSAFTSSFKLVSTEDSSNVDAKSLAFTLNASSPSEIVLGNVSPGSRVVDVSIRVLVPFNGTNPEVSIGDDITGHSAHMSVSDNDLKTQEQYQSESNFVYTGTQETDIKAYYSAAGSTIGQAQIIVTYV